MIIKNDVQYKTLKKSGALLAGILREVASRVRAGIETRELDEIAERLIREAGGVPSFKGYRTHGTTRSYPASLCVSVNDEVVHAIPGKRVIQVGDIVSLDIGMSYDGIFTDTAVTVGVGSIKEEENRLIDSAREALMIGIAAAKAGGRVGDIGSAIETYLRKTKFGIVRELVGHGVGAAVHEEPEIPNWGEAGKGPKLIDGMVIAIEPMIVLGSPRVRVSGDGWAWSTADGSKAAHFEHTLIVRPDEAEVVTL